MKRFLSLTLIAVLEVAAGTETKLDLVYQADEK